MTSVIFSFGSLQGDSFIVPSMREKGIIDGQLEGGQTLCTAEELMKGGNTMPQVTLADATPAGTSVLDAERLVVNEVTAVGVGTPIEVPTPTIPALTAVERAAVLREIFADTKRELKNLGYGELAIRKAAPRPDDEVVDRVLATMGITGRGQNVSVTNALLHETMRVVHSDTNRAMMVLGDDPSRFQEPAVYCHENQQFRTVSTIARAVGCHATRAYSHL